jgi:hypothetical protein
MRMNACCLCPATFTDFKANICENCDFKLTFVDARGWEYFVRAGLSENKYNTFYKKPGKKGDGHSCRMTNWKDSFMFAQEELNELAVKKGWKAKHN